MAWKLKHIVLLFPPFLWGPQLNQYNWGVGGVFGCGGNGGDTLEIVLQYYKDLQNMFKRKAISLT